jgi:hypothetical protein
VKGLTLFVTELMQKVSERAPARTSVRGWAPALAADRYWPVRVTITFSLLALDETCVRFMIGLAPDSPSRRARTRGPGLKEETSK